MDGQGAAAVGVLGIVEPAAQLVGFEVAQVGLGAVFHADAGELFVLPAHDDLLGARLVARFGAGVGELRHGDRAADDKGLARAHVDTHLDDEIGVKLQIGLVHGYISFAFANLLFSIHHLAAKQKGGPAAAGEIPAAGARPYHRVQSEEFRVKSLE